MFILHFFHSYTRRQATQQKCGKNLLSNDCASRAMKKKTHFDYIMNNLNH